MPKLEETEGLKRKIRRDGDMAEMSQSTWSLIAELIQGGEVKEALDFMDYEVHRNKMIHDLLVQFIQELFTEIAAGGEEIVEKFWRKIVEPLMRKALTRDFTPEEALQVDAELQRNHFGEFTVVEEPDRYVMTCDPCGAGGRMRRMRCPQSEDEPTLWPWPREVGATQEAYPWSWGRTGIPYYCVHCTLMWEILSTEILGYPIRIHELGEKPEDPCVHLYYKKPELIPEKYYTRIGKTKKIK